MSGAFSGLARAAARSEARHRTGTVEPKPNPSWLIPGAKRTRILYEKPAAVAMAAPPKIMSAFVLSELQIANAETFCAAEARCRGEERGDMLRDIHDLD